MKEELKTKIQWLEHDLKQLGINAEILDLGRYCDIRFKSEEDLNYYQLCGYFKRTKFLRFIVV